MAEARFGPFDWDWAVSAISALVSTENGCESARIGANPKKKKKKKNDAARMHGQWRHSPHVASGAGVAALELHLCFLRSNKGGLFVEIFEYRNGAR